MFEAPLGREMDLLSCWCSYPNSNITKKKKSANLFQIRPSLWGSEGDVGFLFMSLKYIKDLCFLFLNHCPVEVSKHPGNLLPCSMQDKWQQLLEVGTEKELGTQPGREKSPCNQGWLYGGVILWCFYSRTPRRGGN